MTQKEKAKAYDEALERANELNYVSDRDSLQRKTVEYIFPELRDSEENKDEIIKEEIIQFLLLPHPQFVGNRNYEKWIAWLEKQGNANKEYWRGYREGKQEILDKYAELEKQGEQPTLPKWKYKKDHNPLTRDSITLNKYGCVAKSPSGALVSDVWVIDYDELAKLPKEEIEKQCEKKLTPKHKVGDTIYYNSFGELKSMIVANVVTDSTDSPMYEDKEGNAVFEKDLIEQKLVDKTEPKFKVWDWILYSGDHYEGVRHITKIDEKGYYVERNGLPHCIIPFNHEICMRLWSIADARDGDVLYMDNGLSTCTFIYKSINNGIVQKYASYNKFGFEGTTYLVLNDGYICPATKEQRDALFAKMKEASYEWDADKKELKKIEQNLTVTDEELAKAKKDAYNDALDKNEYHSGEPTFDDGWSAAIWYLKKRNALPQNTWKPSATDIKALEDVIDLHVNPINYHATLHSILEQLKKLREG